jgi:hypothetical protein
MDSSFIPPPCRPNVINIDFRRVVETEEDPRPSFSQNPKSGETYFVVRIKGKAFLLRPNSTNFNSRFRYRSGVGRTFSLFSHLQE